jgi:RNA polymerase sigma factor (sigma-70 family)
MQREGFKDLVILAQGGDAAAMDRLLAELRPHLERIARDYAEPDRAAESASDLVQEAELRAWQKIDQFCGGPDDQQTLAMFRAWAGQIVRRVGLDARRNSATQRRSPPGAILRLGPAAGSTTGGGLQPAGSEPTPSARLRSDEAAQRVRAAIQDLPDPGDREIVGLYFFEGKTLSEIAKLLGIGYEAAKYRYRAAMERLERSLGDLL